MNPNDALAVGFHENISAARYHADPCVEPSLSSGVARTLINQSPAHAHHEHIRLGGHKIEPTPDMILGSYVHGILAGDVTDFEVGTYDNFLSKDAKAWRDSVKLSGKTPVLDKTVSRAEAIARAVREKVAKGITNDPFTLGKPEVTAVWQEEGTWLRSRYDCLVLDESGFADVWDWKTTGDVSPKAVLRTILDKGYHIQAAHYLRGLRAIAPRFAGRTSFIFGFVETEEPYAVRRVTLTEGFLHTADMLLGRAIDDWRRCMSSNVWPDGSDITLTLEPPTWYIKDVEEAA